MGLGLTGRRAPDTDRATFLDDLAAAEVPLARFGRPDEVSGLVAFLAGAVIDVAGGMGRYV